MNGLEYSNTVAGLDLAKKTIDDLYNKYAGDSQIFAKMHNYVCFRLPNMIEEMKRTDDERRVRNEFLSTEQDAFISAFLNDNRYFYCQQTDRYFYYNGANYTLKSEDDVLHHILTAITNECNVLIPRKPQTKVYIMKRIKECNPLKSIPESATIQSVLDALYPTLFQTKSAAKYFLTVLGDNLVKETTHAYFTTPKAKEFLREVGAISQSLFGVNATASFKYKYHSHPFRSIRLVQMNDTVGVESVWRPISQLKMMDLLCVAAHYSGRYESADQYVDSYSDDAELTKYAMYFRWKTNADVVSEFVAEYLRVSDDPANKIAEATMEYLWKRYLKEHQFPAVLSSQGFLSALSEGFPGKYDKESNCFVGFSSSHSGMIDRFQRFWSECIVVDESDTLAEYEIDELVMMYREQYNPCSFGRQSGIAQDTNNGGSRITDAQMLDLIRFYTDVEIIDNKFVQGVKSAVWDKQEELKLFFVELVRTAEENDDRAVSFYDAYLKYQRFCRGRGKKTGEPRRARSNSGQGQNPDHDTRSFPSQDPRSFPSQDPRSFPSQDLRSFPSQDLRSFTPPEQSFITRAFADNQGFTESGGRGKSAERVSEGDSCENDKPTTTKRKPTQMVSKNYFEKYIYELFEPDMIQDGKLVF
jgi:hypothetical protein